MQFVAPRESISSDICNSFCQNGFLCRRITETVICNLNYRRIPGSVLKNNRFVLISTESGHCKTFSPAAFLICKKIPIRSARRRLFSLNRRSSSLLLNRNFTGFSKNFSSIAGTPYRYNPVCIDTTHAKIVHKLLHISESKGIIDMGCTLDILCNSHVICHQ